MPTPICPLSSKPGRSLAKGRERRACTDDVTVMFPALTFPALRSRMMHLSVHGLRGFALMALLVFSASGQTSTSSISGTVTDASDAAVPGAVVIATNESTGVINRQTTTQSGVYSFAALRIGTYSLTVE